MAVSKRTVLITGCSDESLGSALALAFHKAGWRVFASARNTSKLKIVEAAGIEIIELDVMSDKSIAASVSRVKELTGGSLDALVNNAGAASHMPLMDVDLHKARYYFDLNAFSVVTMTRAYLPLLLNASRGALVANHTSGVALISGTMPLQGVYNASKAAASSFTETLRLELAPLGIRVVNVVTGVVKSNFFDSASEAILPPDSLYNVAKEAIEGAMAGKNVKGLAPDPAKWADQVVKDLSKSRPSHWVWRGHLIWVVRWTSFLPVGTLDWLVKRFAGLDVYERKLREQGGPRKLKSS